MTYAALPDMRMPYHRDGTVMALGTSLSGVTHYPSGSALNYVNALNRVAGQWNPNAVIWSPGNDGGRTRIWLFFPERREVTALYLVWSAFQNDVSPNAFGYNAAMNGAGFTVEGSDDTTNGLDGSWETAALGGGAPSWTDAFSWRPGIKPVSFTGGKRVIRITAATINNGSTDRYLAQLHVYGEKVAGQTPDDLIFVNHQDTPGVEYQAPQDFGDRPLGTTVTHTFRVKNASATKTANAINLQCDDTDFAISTDNSTWVTTINIASLAAGAESATLYVRCTTPAPGNILGPRFAEIIAIVGSWT